VLCDKASYHFGGVKRQCLASWRGPISDFSVEEMTGTERKKDLCSRFPAAALKIVFFFAFVV